MQPMTIPVTTIATIPITPPAIAAVIIRNKGTVHNSTPDLCFLYIAENYAYYY